MGSLSSEEDDQVSSERCGSYSPSADISESESSTSFDGEGPSSSIPSSPRVVAGRGFYFPPPVMLPVIGGKDVLWDDKQSDNNDFSGTVYNFLSLTTTTRIRFIFRIFLVFWVSEIEMMKERFAKLLLGEDMSGGGKGVCTALAISNAITNLSGKFIFLS